MYEHVIRKLKEQKETQVEAKIERKFNVFPIKLQPLLFCLSDFVFPFYLEFKISYNRFQSKEP